MSTSTVLSGMALCMVAAFGSGCGAALQYAYGFDEQVTRPAKRTRAVRIEGLPAGAEVERYDAEGAHPLEDPTHDLVEYDVVETVAVPRSRVPMFIGSALDAAALAGTLYLGLEHDRSGIVKYYVSYPASSLVADLAFAIIYSRDREPRVERYAPAPTEPVAYVARVGDTLYEAQVDVAWSDRVVFDDEHRVEPGAPRIALPQPPAPRPEVSIDPHTKPPSTWYGWQLLPIDAGAAALVVVGIQQDETAMIVGGAALAGLAPALVHLGNGEGRNAASSLGLRLGVPLALGGVMAGIGAGLGALVEVSSPDCIGCGSTSAVKVSATIFGLAGVITGGVLGPLADDVFLAWKEEQGSLPSRAPTLSVVPTAGVTPDGRPTFGLAGRF